MDGTATSSIVAAASGRMDLCISELRAEGTTDIIILYPRRRQRNSPLCAGSIGLRTSRSQRLRPPYDQSAASRRTSGARYIEVQYALPTTEAGVNLDRWTFPLVGIT